MVRRGGVPGVGGGQCLLVPWGQCLLVRSQPRVLFSSDAMRRGSVRAARRFMRALSSGKFVFHLPVCTRRRADGARAEDRYGEVWKAHWHGSRPAEAPVINSQNPPVS